MKVDKILKIDGTLLNQVQLENYLQKIASNHNLVNNSKKETYPIPHLIESYEVIKTVYNLLNEHLKIGISIHPAGEWLLDNFYIIEETVKQIQKELTLKKYVNFLGIGNGKYKGGISIHPAGEWLLDNFYIIEETVKQIQKELTLKKYVNFLGIGNGKYKGYARIYVLASEIVAYTDNKIERRDLEDYLKSYQSKKTLSMEEIWNIGVFLQIAIIENIREISEKIYNSQIQKYKAENIVERLIENKSKSEQNFTNFNNKLNKIDVIKDMKYPFIEYMSYILRRYGKKGYSYLKALEETVEMTGTTIQEVTKKEHFDIAVTKVLIGNSITSIRNIQRINFLEIFEQINGVEEILKQDPADVYSKMDNNTKECYRNKIKEISKKTKISEIYIEQINGVEEILKQDPADVYSKMDNNTKECYRNKIKEISKKTKISEIYIAKKILEIAKNKKEGSKQYHIGYYLIGEGIDELYEKLNFKKKKLSKNLKAKLFAIVNIVLTLLISVSISAILNVNIQKLSIFIIGIVIFLLPSSEIATQIIQYILNKIVKPKMIPKIDFTKGIDIENSCMVIIPTILKSREKVKELSRKLEVYYIANKSENIYFTLLGDCTEEDTQDKDFDEEIIKEGIEQCKRLNKKYSKENDFPIFNFIYRKREWNEKEGKYLGWERKRGMITQFNEYILGNEVNKFKANTIENNKDILPQIKYIITLDADTDLILNSAFELVGAMAHILNKPIIDEEKNIVTEGHALIQPRIGINLDVSYKTIFTKLFAGDGGIDSYTNAISDLYQDDFNEGIFTGKGIYDLQTFSRVLKNAGGIDSYTNAISDLYQDNFNEGIFTGKGIYDLKIFSKVLKNAIPENTVLSHDLLEGSYLRCGLATDILLMDGYPTKYNSFMNRLSRWIRGDWQIIKWITSKVSNKENKIIKNPLNFLSKYKIFDNLRRSLLDISILFACFISIVIAAIYKVEIYPIITIMISIGIFPYLLEILNRLIMKKEGEQKQKTFEPKITGYKGIILRSIVTISCLPYKAYMSLKAIIKTIYRVTMSHKNLLEWLTSEEADKQSKDDYFSYYKQMWINMWIGILCLFYIYSNRCNI